MAHKLKVTETNNKAGKYHYQVIDEAGNIVSERKSNREYSACLVGGSSYFGRVDLAQKFLSQHYKWYQDCKKNDPVYAAKAYGDPYRIPEIAYLEQPDSHPNPGAGFIVSN